MPSVSETGTRDLQMPTNFVEAGLYDRWQEDLATEAKEEDEVERVRRQLRE